jgi:hypothetical protein
MLYQDRLGILREIPDSQVYGLGFAEYPYGESQIVYDGLGNPVGAWPFSNIAKSIGGLVSKALPAVASFIPGGSLISQALPALAQGMAPSPAVPQPAPTALPQPAPAALMSPGALSPMPVPLPSPPIGPSGMPMQMGPTGLPVGPTGMPFMPPAIPTGWIRPPLPYTGLGPRRLYMRCAVWPGPSGLVPEIAAQAPAAPAQAAAAAAAQTAMGLMRRRRVIRRR